MARTTGKRVVGKRDSGKEGVVGMGGGGVNWITGCAGEVKIETMYG